MHEIQHAIQKVEGFTQGSSPESWNGERGKSQREEAVRRIQSEIGSLEDLLESGAEEESKDFIRADIAALKKTLDNLSYHMYRNMAGSELTMYDEDGNAETVHLARENDRVKKDGAKNSRKVLDELARYKGDNIKALATVHLSELLETSGQEKTTDEHSHQWLDENGWRTRKAYAADRNGKIYEMTLNIADGKRGLMMYKISDVHQIGTKKEESPAAKLPSSETGSGRTTSQDSSDASIEDNGLPVKWQFSLSEPVEQTETLLALHNMDEEKLRRTLNLGAWPSPSIAIVEAAQGHSNYGEFSAVFPRNVIDPAADNRNKVYGSDAWTPTWRNAQVEYEVDFDEALAVVSPDSTPAELLAAMRNAGMNVVTYEAGNEENRLAVVNSVEGAKFSISETDDGKAVAVVDDDILSEIDTTSWNREKKEAAKKALLKFKDGIRVNGITYKVNHDSWREYTWSRDTNRTYRKTPDAFADKMRAAANADDIITATTSWANDGKLKHERTDNFTDFAHGDVLIQAGQNQYRANTAVGITTAGEYVLYDVVDMEPANFKIKEKPSSTPFGITAAGDIQEDFSNDRLSDNIPPVKEQFSIDDQGERRGEVIQNLRRYMNGELSTQDIRRYIDDMDDTPPKTVNLQTYGQTETQKIVDKDEDGAGRPKTKKQDSIANCYAVL